MKILEFKILSGKNISNALFKSFFEILESSFLKEEFRSFENQKALLEKDIYQILFCFSDDELIGIMAFWHLSEFTFIEHFAVKEPFRGKGIGRKMMKLLQCKNKNNVILEVELPYNEMNVKRIEFYKKLRFKYNDFEYYQAPLNKGDKPLPLRIMSYPESISKSEFDVIKNKLIKSVYKN